VSVRPAHTKRDVPSNSLVQAMDACAETRSQVQSTPAATRLAQFTCVGKLRFTRTQRSQIWMDRTAGRQHPNLLPIAIADNNPIARMFRLERVGCTERPHNPVAAAHLVERKRRSDAIAQARSNGRRSAAKRVKADGSSAAPSKSSRSPRNSSRRHATNAASRHQPRRCRSSVPNLECYNTPR
jgi:hypothetical protein